MAIQSDVYEGSSLDIRTFPSSKHIATKQHMAVWRRLVIGSTWEQMDVSLFQLINNSCVLNSELNTVLYDKLEIRVADAPDELTTSLSDIAVVAGISSEIATVAGSIDGVNTVSGSVTNVNVVATSIDGINTTAGNTANINTVAGINADVTTVSGISGNVTTVAGISADVTTTATTVAPVVADVTTVATDIVNVNTVATNIDGINTVATNIAEVLLADDNAAIATTQAGIATTKAAEAAASAILAASYASNPMPMTLTGNGTGLELSTVVITDTDYDANGTYLASVDFGSVVDNADGTYTITLPDYSVSTTVIFTLVGGVLGYDDVTSTHNITVTNTQVATPDFTGSATTGAEGTVVVLTDVNYEATATYTSSVDFGSRVDNGDGTYSVTLPAFGVATLNKVTFSIYGVRAGDIDSVTTNYVIDVTEVAFVADDAISDDLTTDVLVDGF